MKESTIVALSVMGVVFILILKFLPSYMENLRNDEAKFEKSQRLQ